jgi:arylsulfatase
VTENFKINGQYVNTPDEGVVGIPFFDSYVEQDALDFLEEAAQSDAPFFINVNFMKLHQPSMPAPEYQGSSISKTKYADSMVEMDALVGNILAKVDELGLRDNTIVFWTTDNGAWQDVYPDAGYTPFRGTKGTVREGGNRVPAIVRWPGKVEPDTKSAAIVGGLDLMATFAEAADIDLPTEDREGQPIVFDSISMMPVWTQDGEPQRKSWFYFTENELTPGAARVGNYKAVFNLRGDDGAQTGGMAVDTNLGWKGAEKYAAMVPQVFDLLQDPQERYDVFMNSYTEHTWTLITFNTAIADLMKTYIENPPRKMQGEGYNGPITLSGYQRFKYLRDSLAEDGFSIGLPSGN